MSNTADLRTHAKRLLYLHKRCALKDHDITDEIEARDLEERYCAYFARDYIRECEAHEKTQKKLDAAVNVLREIEWAAQNEDGTRFICPICHEVARFSNGAHRNDCALWAIIKPEGDE